MDAQTEIARLCEPFDGAAAAAWTGRRGDSLMVVRSRLRRDAASVFYRGLGYAQHKTLHAYTRTLTP
ncbi:MAG: hypothetical protein E6Q88_03515 [Lysobacteraceae bacterium]|nr:MAG: hypothetical protein E6Q88_03515 [Xanthomonadaceae bacterium]